MKNYLYTNLKNLGNICNLSSIFFIIKAWCYQTFFEIALSIFAIEGLVLYTDLYSGLTINNMNGNNLIVVILLPIVFAALISILCDIIVFLTFTNKLCHTAETAKDQPSVRHQPLSIEKSMKQYMRIANLIIGFLYPLVTSILVLYILPVVMKIGIDYRIKVVALSLSTAFGVIWGIRAYYTNIRIDWNLVFKNPKNSFPTEITEISKYRKMKCQASIMQFIMNLVAIFLFICCFVWIILNFRDGVFLKDPQQYGVFSSAFFFTAFGTLISLCVKNYYSLYYKDGIGIIYSKLNNLIKSDDDIEKEHIDTIE